MNLAIIQSFSETLLKTYSRSERTVKTYMWHIGKFIIFFEDVTGKEFSPEVVSSMSQYDVTGVIEQFTNSISEYSDQTRNLYSAALRCFFSWMKGRGLLDRDYKDMLPVVKSKSQYEAEPYTTEEMKKLLSYGGPNKRGKRFRAVIAVFYGTGLRLEELCNLNISHYTVWKQGGEAKIKRKGGKICNVAISKYVFPYVDEYLSTRKTLKADDPLILSETEKRMTPLNIYRMVANGQKKLGIRTGIHTIRHTVVSEVFKENPSAAKDIASHGSFSTTQIYVHNTPTQRADALNGVFSR